MPVVASSRTLVATMSPASSQPPPAEPSSTTTTTNPPPADTSTDERTQEGNRAQKLRTMFERALGKSIGIVSYENFEGCFPTSARNSPEVLREAWRQMRAVWEVNAKKEYEIILQERKVVPALNELDVILEEARERRKAAPEGDAGIAPSLLHPATIVQAHLTPLLVEAQESVKTKIAQAQTENDGLMEEIRQQRKEIEELVAALGKNMEYVEEAVGQVQNAVGGKAFAEELEKMEIDGE